MELRSSVLSSYFFPLLLLGRANVLCLLFTSWCSDFHMWNPSICHVEEPKHSWSVCYMQPCSVFFIQSEFFLLVKWHCKLSVLIELDFIFSISEGRAMYFGYFPSSRTISVVVVNPYQNKELSPSILEKQYREACQAMSIDPPLPQNGSIFKVHICLSGHKLD